MRARLTVQCAADSDTAQIINFRSLFVRRRRACLSDTNAITRRKATLLSLQQSLNCFACVLIDQARFSATPADTQCSRENKAYRRLTISRLLEAEFGALRVSCHQGHEGLLFVRHRYIEQLIAGLLRVQYAARNMQCPQTRDKLSQTLGKTGIIVSWGVGSTVTEAMKECLCHTPE